MSKSKSAPPQGMGSARPGLDPPPPPPTKGTIVKKKTKFTDGKIWSGHFRYTNCWVPSPGMHWKGGRYPPPSPSGRPAYAQPLSP